MVGRNQKGQVLIESVFLMLTFVTLLTILQSILKNHQSQIGKHRLSTEITRGYENENSKN